MRAFRELCDSGSGKGTRLQWADYLWLDFANALFPEPDAERRSEAVISDTRGDGSTLCFQTIDHTLENYLPSEPRFLPMETDHIAGVVELKTIMTDIHSNMKPRG